MQFYQGHQTLYTYSAAGTKLKVVDKTAPAGVNLPVTSLDMILANPSVASTTTTDYVGNMIYQNGALQTILLPEGYWQGGVYYYYLKDHLGSNRVVINGSGTIVESSNFYPSGMRFGESVASGGNVQPYRHAGKEMQSMHGLNWYDNGARMRQVDIPVWTTVDSHAEKYYDWSPYAYCKGNSVNAVDPDGRLVIFINGNHYGDGASSTYWNGIDKTVMSRVNDYHVRYEDGALGGWLPFNWPSEGRREASGYGEGKLHASLIIASLKRNDKGELIESIKVITHSMGAAFAKGYIKAIIEEARKMGITVPLVAFEADFAPYEPDKQIAVKDPLMGPTLQFSHSKDPFAGNKKEQGAEQENTIKDENQGHGISGFMDEIKKLPAGNYKIVDGKIVPF